LFTGGVSFNATFTKGRSASAPTGTSNNQDSDDQVRGGGSDSDMLFFVVAIGLVILALGVVAAAAMCVKKRRGRSQPAKSPAGDRSETTVRLAQHLHFAGRTSAAIASN